MLIESIYHIDNQINIITENLNAFHLYVIAFSKITIIIKKIYKNCSPCIFVMNIPNKKDKIKAW